MHWEWRGMTVNFMYGKAINLGNRNFAYGARKHANMCAQSIPHPRFSLPHAAGASWGVFSRFSVVSFIYPWLEIRFCAAQLMGRRDS